VEGGHWTEALKHFDTALAAAPARPGMHLQRAYAREAMGDFAGADVDYRAEIRLRPDVPYLRSQHGDALLAAGRIADARAAFDAVIRLAPSWPTGWVKRCVARASLLDKGALADCDKAAAAAELPAGSTDFLEDRCLA